MKKRLHPIEVILMIFSVLFLTSGVMARRTQSELAGKVVRLHVLANSDSEEDQALKLRVRDAILERTTETVRGTENRETAQERLTAILPELQDIAERTVHDAGHDYAVRVELKETAFPTKEYEGFALPAGEYLALRVLIGEAEGQNWWCVVFPPLCGAAAVEVPAAALSAGLTEEDVALITEENTGYVLKFKTVELWETLRQKWNA